MIIRPLNAASDMSAVATFYGETTDFWLLMRARMSGPQMAADFFTDAPPGCDPKASLRLGLYPDSGRMGGVAVLSFGFPTAGSAYFDLLLLTPALRGQGYGAMAVQQVEHRARQAGARAINLAVLAANPRARAFWEREGYRATGHSGFDKDSGQVLYRLGKSF